MDTVKSEAATITGYVEGVATIMMLDLESSVSVLKRFAFKDIKICENPAYFITATLRASEDETLIRDYVSVAVQLNKERISHDFVVVDKLIVSVILGVDFLQGNGLTLDFSSTLFKVGSHNSQAAACIYLEARTSGVPLLLHHQPNNKNCVSALVNGDDCESDVVDERAIPSFVDNCCSELPTCSNKTLSLIIQDKQDLFRTAPALTSLACHNIPMSGSSIRVPPRRVSAHYRNEVEIQIKDMLVQGRAGSRKS